jgi:radical SAM protein with 4Fe4S-binding SPASM domain
MLSLDLIERMKITRGLKINAGLYTYRGEGEFMGLALQLRIEPDGSGLLVINANTVLYLNQTAATHAYFFMMGMDTIEAVENVRRIYRVKKKFAREYHEKIIYSISTLAQTEEVCPLSYLDVERIEPFSQNLSAPIRVDLALTFRCQNQCVHCYTGGSHETQEIDTEQWKGIIDKLKSVGVFILTFTGGEPTLREDLPKLLHYAQSEGIVTGLVTNGRRLGDKSYVETLEKAGLDFVQITIESHDSKIHDSITGEKGSWHDTLQGIKNLISTTIYTTTNTTLNKCNAKKFLETIKFLHDLGIETFGCNSIIYSGKALRIADEFALDMNEIKDLLIKIQEKAEHLGMKFMWYTPTQYCHLNPINLGLGVKSCSAARINMCVGPNGEAYPCQSYFQSVGNILRDSWSSIWNHPIFKSIRGREYVQEECNECPDLLVCGGGCPLELKAKNTFAENHIKSIE